MTKTAVILAGGKGTRLYPYTVALPKPLVPVANTPILEIIIRQLAKYDFRNLILAVNHQAELVRAYFGDGSKYGLKISYSLETKPLSTIGPLKLISDLPKNFLVMNGDVLTDIDYLSFFEWHQNERNDFSISAFNTIEQSEFGVLDLDANGLLNGFHEKPKREMCVSMGVYAVNKNVLEIVPDNKAFGFDDLMREGLDSNLRIAGHKHTGYWRDLGTPEQYQLANNEIADTDLARFLCEES